MNKFNLYRYKAIVSFIAFSLTMILFLIDNGCLRFSLSCLLSIYVFFTLIFNVRAYKAYRHFFTLRDRLIKIRKKYPNAANKYSIPSNISDNDVEKYEYLSNKTDSEWEKEELYILRGRMMEIRKKYPNAANKYSLPSTISDNDVEKYKCLSNKTDSEWGKEELNITLRERLIEIRKKYPNAANRYSIPSTISDNVVGKYEFLLNKTDREWEQEELKGIDLNFLLEKGITIALYYSYDNQVESFADFAKCMYNAFNDLEDGKEAAEKLKLFLPKIFACMLVDPRLPDDFAQRLDDVMAIRNFNLDELGKEQKGSPELNTIKNIEKDIQTLQQATDSGNIELADYKVKSLNDNVKKQTIDKELLESIKKAEDDYEHRYAEGYVDKFETSYVDYDAPLNFVQGKDWTYAVAKFPSRGNVVFPYRRRKVYRRGYMESHFQKYLADKLYSSNLLIIGDCGILHTDDHLPYEPDIAIIDNEHPSIRIDIEIDEPYSAIENKPIHYIDCGDDFRDMRLNNLGWIVVRFSEQQIVRNMEGCTAFVAQLIHALNPQKAIPSFLLSYPSVQPQKRWTEIEAKIMASEKLREEYLNHEFGIVDNKRIETADIKQTDKEKESAKLVKPIDFNGGNTNKDVAGRDVSIQFNPQEHIYLYKGKEQFVPVSNIIELYFPFDSYKESAKIASRDHCSQGEILDKWEMNNSEARELGTFMHQQIEKSYAGEDFVDTYQFKYNGKYASKDEVVKLDSEHEQFDAFTEDHKFKPFRTEWHIYDVNLKIAGTVDMIHQRGNVYDIYDWKRSHRIVNPVGNPIPPYHNGDCGIGELGNIPNSPYWQYCIQQNIYKYILEKNYNVKIENMYLVVFNNKAEKYHKLLVPNMGKEVSKIIERCNDGTIRKKYIESQCL